MIVDDELINIEVLKVSLADRGYASDCATNGSDALNMIKYRYELVKQGKAIMYKLMLLDYSMPNMDGPELARQARIFFKERSTS